LNASVVPSFEPHPWLRGGHIQTIAGRYLPGRRVRLVATYHELPLADGDRLSVLDSIPAPWRRGDPGAVLVHGLGGCARASYVVRVADRLVRQGVRVVRMNLRSAGSGFGGARGVYHSGRTADVRAVVDWLGRAAPGSPLALVGFSLGANLVLKLAAEAADEPVDGLDCVLAANPPLDLAACCRHIQAPANRLYDRNFAAGLKSAIERHHAAHPELGPPNLATVRSLYGFDDCYTAPRHGFAGAEDYYARSSAGPVVPRIELAGLVVHAEDDPFIPADTVRAVRFPPQIRLEMVPSGGHLGYIARTPVGGDRRWLDARLAGWLGDRWKRLPVDPASVVEPVTEFRGSLT
jgi:predicted alpha/beta-fold hydrolase